MKRALAIVALLAACEGDFVPGSTITELRVLGAILETEPGRVDVQSGAELTTTFLVSAPNAAPRGTLFVLACEEGNVDPQRGPLCASPAFAAESLLIEEDDPAITLRVPAIAGRFLLQGVACAEGLPVDTGRIGEDGFIPDDVCTGEAGNVFSLPIPVASDDWPNTNPDFGDAPLRIEGQRWDLEGGCGAPAERTISPGDILEIDVGPVDEANREETSAGERERLLVSHFTTAGELDRQFSFVNDEDAESRVEWDAPLASEVSAEGVTVHFDFVLRDGRLGSDRIQRQLCVRP
ncbi:MAG: hypothetical protein AAGE52_03005 [Myxococcota bacterium]